MRKTVIIDDKAEFLDFLALNFENNNIISFKALTGCEGLYKIKMEKPDFIILGIGLTDIDGFEVLEDLKNWCQIPIFIISSRNSKEDFFKATNFGVKHYLIKPINFNELLELVNSEINISQNHNETLFFQTGNLFVDFVNHIVKIENKEIHLTEHEFNILKLLAQNAERPLRKEFINKEIWGEIFTDQFENLREHIKRIRKKIEKDLEHPKLLITEPKFGYRLMKID